MLYFAIASLVALIIVNGMTDAPNAITCTVVTGSLSLRKAAALAGVFNLVGCICSVILGGGVASFTFSLTGFAGYAKDSASLVALTMGILSVVIWSLAAWYFGIPTSESHGMLAAVSGACCAYAVRFDIPLSEALSLKGWLGVALGLALSTVPPFWFSRFFSRLSIISREKKRKRNASFYRHGQIACAALNALLHGAQDGQKFVGIGMVVLALAGGKDKSVTMLAVAIPVAVLISLGTLLGGRRIIEQTGRELVSLDLARGFCADLTSSFFLGISLAAGLPVSTTHAKTCAIMGAGRGINASACTRLISAWLATFPVCFAVGFSLAYIALS